MSQYFSSTLVPEWKVEALRKLVDRPRYQYTIRELAEATPGSYGSVNSFVHQLQDWGVVEFVKKGNSILVSYQEDNPYSQLISLLVEKESDRLEEIAREYAGKLVEKAGDNIVSVILFGSVARGTATETSDVDVLVVCQDGEKEAVEKDARDEELLDSLEHETVVSPVVETEETFRNKLGREKAFELQVKKDGIVLEGEDIIGPHASTEGST